MPNNILAHMTTICLCVYLPIEIGQCNRRLIPLMRLHSNHFRHFPFPQLIR